jgi:diguanylate cyclase (GGDEF)-like protein
MPSAHEVDSSGRGAASGAPEVSEALRQTLEDLVTNIAVSLMSVSSASLPDALTDTLREISTCFEVDTSFLRQNDHRRGLSVLLAEYPIRPDVPDPDPLGAVPFDVDPVFAATRELREPFVMRPDSSPDAYQDRVQQGSGVQQVSMAMVPLMGQDVTLGVLGFVKFGDRPWHHAEINALRAVASLIVQLQARVAAEERLLYSANHDDLTGLGNRRALLAELDIRMRQKRHTAVLHFDIDRFKAMNDFLGQVAGDQQLTPVADRLVLTAGRRDFVVRLGADEFVVLLDAQVEGPALLEEADRWLAVMAEPVDLGGHLVLRTASIGVSASHPETVTVTHALAHATAAMRLAKEQGGNRAVVFDDEMRNAAKQRTVTEMLLRDAIDNGELELYYQPEIDLATGELMAVEALVRWNHPSRGLLAAAEFIGVAEVAGLIVDLGTWVTGEACRQIAEWRLRYPDLRLHMRVNMSPAQLATGDIVGLVARSLAENQLPGWLLCLEITEHAVMQDMEHAVEKLHQLRALGVSLALDDFGTGFSSMSYLKQLPVDTIKIDRMFVSGLNEDGGDRAIVSATIGLAKAFGLEVVAEGVETADLVPQLLEMGCRRAQGYLMSRPKPPADLEDLLAAGGLEPDLFWPAGFVAPIDDDAVPSGVASLWPGHTGPRVRERPVIAL